MCQHSCIQFAVTDKYIYIIGFIVHHKVFTISSQLLLRQQDENSTYRMYSQKNTTELNKIPLSTSKFTKQFASILNGCNLTKEVKQRYGSRLTDHPDSNIRSTQKRDSLDIDELIQ